MSRLRVTWPFQALADETRFRVVRLILGYGAPLTAGQVASSLGIAANHLSRHLQILEAAGVIAIDRRGRSHFISLAANGGFHDSLFATVLAMADSTGLLKQDLARLLTSNGQAGVGEIYVSGDAGGDSALSESSVP